MQANNMEEYSKYKRVPKYKMFILELIVSAYRTHAMYVIL